MLYWSNGDTKRARTRAVWWMKALTGALVIVALIGSVLLQGEDAPRSATEDTRESDPLSTVDTASLSRLLADAEDRARGLEAEARSLEELYATELDPLIHGLMRLGDDLDHAKRIAVALVREGWRSDIPPQLLLAVISVENPWLELGARSPVGAVGLMQVMPFHAGAWGCDGHDLTDLETNICHGTKILAHAIRRSDGDLGRALLAYNGCVNGTNTPDCHRYPAWVLGNAAPGWANGWEERQWVASAASVGLE
jgi:hypothetical protein